MSRLRRFLCNILDWHSPSNITYDEVNSHSHCKHCGKKYYKIVMVIGSVTR